jgi:hypothetical protein
MEKMLTEDMEAKVGANWALKRTDQGAHLIIDTSTRSGGPEALPDDVRGGCHEGMSTDVACTGARLASWCAIAHSKAKTRRDTEDGEKAQRAYSWRPRTLAVPCSAGTRTPIAVCLTGN